MRTYFTSILILVAGFAASCTRQSANVPAAPLIQTATVPADKLLPGPPQKGSEQDRADLAEVLRLQKSRTAQDCERARFENSPNLETLFGPRYPGLLTREQVEKLGPAFKRIFDDIRPVVGTAKDRWPRGRPSIEHPEVTPCLERETSGSYPSGHAMLSTVFAETLAILYPDKKGALAARSRQANEDRVLSGLHYPSDVRDGEALGRAVFDTLLRNPEFVKLLEGLPK